METLLTHSGSTVLETELVTPFWEVNDKLYFAAAWTLSTGRSVFMSLKTPDRYAPLLGS